MSSSKFLLILGLLLALCLAVLADTSKEKEANSVEQTDGITKDETDAVEPEQYGRPCKHGCCKYSHGRCIRCCYAETAAETEKETDAVEPQQRCGCRRGCCGACARGECAGCCSRKMTFETEDEKEEAKP